MQQKQRTKFFMMVMDADKKEHILKEPYFTKHKAFKVGESLLDNSLDLGDGLISAPISAFFVVKDVYKEHPDVTQIHPHGYYQDGWNPFDVEEGDEACITQYSELT